MVKNKVYEAHKIRSQPFKWINFPKLVVIWLILYWIILIPVVYTKLNSYYHAYHHESWPNTWYIYFAAIAFFIFIVIMAILIILWKIHSPKVYVPKKEFEKVFLNPDLKNQEEKLCEKCLMFHLPSEKFCSIPEGKLCVMCGRLEESFGNCCRKNQTDEKILEGPSYDIIIKKQQLQENDDDNKSNIKPKEKRNSLRSNRSRHSSSSGVIISMHNIGTKELINRNIEINSKNKINNSILNDEKNADFLSKENKTKKPKNLKPIDIELANRHSNLENNMSNETKETKSTPLITPKTGSISSIESMNKEKFRNYLHLVEINSPSTPDNSIKESKQVVKSPMTPREIFFYDLMQAAENSNSVSTPESSNQNFNKQFEKKRPTSYILLSSDVELNSENEKTEASKRHTINYDSTSIQIEKYPFEEKIMDEISIKQIKCKQDDKSQLPENIRSLQTKYLYQSTSQQATPTSSLSEQISVKDYDNLKKDSVSDYFITDLKGNVSIKPKHSNANNTNQD